MLELNDRKWMAFQSTRSGLRTRREMGRTDSQTAVAENGSSTLVANARRYAGATWVIPTENEWHNAAYDDPVSGVQ